VRRMPDGMSTEQRLVTIASPKGGVGKSTIALHLAGALDATLVDLDWEVAGVSNLWGFDPRRSRRGGLLEALDAFPDSAAPHRRVAPNRPALVAGHKNMAHLDPERGAVADALLAWAAQWGAGHVVVDTHPGVGALRDGAIEAADLVVVPVHLAHNELEGLDDFLAEALHGYRVLVVPNRVRMLAPERVLVRRLMEITSGRAYLAEPIGDHGWLPRRRLRMTLTQTPGPGVAQARAAQQFRNLAHRVEVILNEQHALAA
jgi:chromosome partitioning protein